MPGAVFHLRDGALVAVDSPGAPGADALLLNSGRISESDWTAALRSGAEARSHRAELVAGGSIKSIELRVISVMAAQDGTFSAYAGRIERYVVTTDRLDVLLPVSNGIDVDWLIRETSRRLDALASLRVPVSPFRDRVAPAPGVDPSVGDLPTLRRQILSVADGRRSARDIAFLIGRSVYSVTVEISRMLGERLLQSVLTTPLVIPATVRTAAPRAQPKPQPASADEGDAARPALPQRSPGASGITEEQLGSTSPGWRLLPLWRRRIRAGPQASETTESLYEPERKDLGP